MKGSLGRNFDFYLIVCTWHRSDDIAASRDPCHISRNVEHDERNNSHSVVSRASLEAILRSRIARDVAAISHEFSMEHRHDVVTWVHRHAKAILQDTCSA